jgi:Carboxypeptidase regulatory-like domain
MTRYSAFHCKLCGVLGAIILLCCAIPARAQSTFGDILGVVKDGGQDLVGGAGVTLTSIDEKDEHSAATDGDGAFHFVNLKPGHYDLVVKATGFADYKVASIQLDARQSLRLDIVLRLATSAQTIEVSGDSGPVINTENGTIGDTKDFKEITDLPVNYRGATTSPLAMLATVTGAQQDANGNVSVGGGLPSQVQYSVDGSSTVNIRQNGALGNMNPSSELISEFKVTQFNNNAEFAQLGDVTISTKSGGDQFQYAVSATRTWKVLEGLTILAHSPLTRVSSPGTRSPTCFSACLWPALAGAPGFRQRPQQSHGL